MKTDEIKLYFERTHWIAKRQTEGLSHADSLLRVASWDNSMNWVVGHIVNYRDLALELLGQETVMAQAEFELYKRESEPMADADAVPLPDLLKMLDESQEKLTAALSAATPETMDAIFNEERQQTIRDRLTFIMWHETYHAGQLEILRQLAGKNDRII